MLDIPVLYPLPLLALIFNFQMSQYHGGPYHHILRWHFVENSPNILHVPTFCIHANQFIARKDIWIPSTFNNPLMNTPALLKCLCVGTCIQHPHKSNKVRSHIDLYCICWSSSSAFYLCAHFIYPNIMVVQVTTSQDGIFFNTLSASSMLAHFTYMSIKLLPASTFEFHPLSMICSWTNLPSCSAIVLAHAFNTPQK